jgi:predicted ArsR family transcriptional regulator
MADASEPGDLAQRVAGIAALDQPLRHQLYRLLGDRGDWVTRDEAAERLGLPRSVAAFHLDKLAEAGLVEIRFERTGDRRGPGAGRPSKMYRRRNDEVAASIPDRRYELAGSMLLEAVAESVRTSTPIATVLAETAREQGRRLGAAASGRRSAAARRGALVTLLERNGYEPRTIGRGSTEIVLGNCPFHRLAEQQRALVCGMNLDFVRGLIEGLGGPDGLDASLAPEPGACCVRITAA